MDRVEADRPGAREALESIDVVRRRRSVLPPPRWLHWGLGGCMVVEGLAYLVTGAPRVVMQVGVIVAVLALSLGAQRRSGVVSRLMQPPDRPVAAWVVFLAVVVGAVLLTVAAGRVGLAPLAYFAVAVLIVTVGPRLHALWGRWT